MDEYNKGLIAPDVLKEVDELKEKVISGAIVVPNYFDLTAGRRRWAHRRWRRLPPSRTRSETYQIRPLLLPESAPRHRLCAPRRRLEIGS